jgi:drug/metabolite transporter (DMT)-like permease
MVHEERVRPNQPLDTISTCLIVIAVAFWGFAFPLLKIAVRYIPPLTLGWVRYMVAALPLLIYFMVREGPMSLLRPLKRDWRLFVAMGFFMVALPNATQNIGIQYTTASLSSLIQTSEPIFTIILASMFLDERLSMRKVGGTLMALTASILLVWLGGLSLGGGKVFIGNVLMFICSVSYGVSAVFTKAALRRNDPLKTAAIAMFLGSIMLIPTSLAIGEPVDWFLGMPDIAWLVLALLCLFPCLFATVLWYHVLTYTEVSRQILFLYLIPVFASVGAFATWGEVLTPISILLGVIIVISVLFAQSDARSKRGRRSRRPGR